MFSLGNRKEIRSVWRNNFEYQCNHNSLPILSNFSLQPSVQFWGSIILSHTMPYPNGCGSLIQCPNNSKVHKCSQQFGIRFVFGFREGQMSSGYLSPVHLMPFPVPKARWLLNHLLQMMIDLPQDSWLCETWPYNHAALKWTNGILEDPAKCWSLFIPA